MVTKHSLDELRRQMLELPHGRGDSTALEAAIRRRIRAARGDSAMVAQFRLMLGEVFASTGEPAKARAQYREVLERLPDSVEAMIGIGHSFHATSRLGRAEEWFQSAYRTAREQQDGPGQLLALDAIALNADLRGDDRVLSDALEAMCDVLASGPCPPGVYTMTAEWLIMKGRGKLALPYLERLVTHALEGGYSRAPQYLVLRPLVEIWRREGFSDEQISGLLDKLRPADIDQTVARDFDIAVGWAFEKGLPHYQYVYGDRQ